MHVGGEAADLDGEAAGEGLAAGKDGGFGGEAKPGGEVFGEAEAGAAGVKECADVDVADGELGDGDAVGHKEGMNGAAAVGLQLARGERDQVVWIVEGEEEAAENSEAEHAVAGAVGVEEVVLDGPNGVELDARDGEGVNE